MDLLQDMPCNDGAKMDMKAPSKAPPFLGRLIAQTQPAYYEKSRHTPIWQQYYCYKDHSCKEVTLLQALLSTPITCIISLAKLLRYEPCSRLLHVDDWLENMRNNPFDELRSYAKETIEETLYEQL